MKFQSGKRTRFGMAWELDRVGPSAAALKGGAISGFTHYVLAVPDEEVFVILLTNRGPEEAHRPGMLCVRFAGWML